MENNHLPLHPKKGLRIGAKLAFWDESGFSERPFVHRTWAPRGATPIVVSTGSWSTRAAVGAITCTPTGRKPRCFLRIVRGTVKAPGVVRTLKDLRRHVRGTVILIWDRLPAHRSKMVQDFIRSQPWLLQEWLPSYAPELNPIEYMWSSAKRKDHANTCPEDLQDLDERIRKSRRRFQRNPDVLEGCLKASGLF